MKKQTKWIFAGVCALLLAGLVPAPVRAQDKMEVKEKPPMYSYIANWELSRDKWKDMETEMSKDGARLNKFLTDGTIIGYGRDVNLIHQEGQSTHDDWWSTMSWAGLLNVLQAQKASGSADAPVFATGKHHDNVYVSRYYNWKPGSFTNGYTHVAVWTLKDDAPSDAVTRLAKNMFVPQLEKLFADGAIYEYEIDQEAIHTSSPRQFLVVFIANGPEGLDKWSAGLEDMQKSDPLALTGFGSWIEGSTHRDSLDLTTATYK
jgi:hypothetical protein